MPRPETYMLETAGLEPGSGIGVVSEPIGWRGYEFAPRGRQGETIVWWCIELACTVVRYDLGSWVCRGMAGGPSANGASAAHAIDNALLGLHQQHTLAGKILAQVAERLRG